MLNNGLCEYQKTYEKKCSLLKDVCLPGDVLLVNTDNSVSANI